MYESPIKIIQGQIKMEMESNIMRAVQSYDIHVDKSELLRALQYDRGQYEKGFQDAVMDRDLVEVVRCKDCKFYHDKGYCTKTTGLTRIKPDYFCSYGERKDNEID